MQGYADERCIFSPLIAINFNLFISGCCLTTGKHFFLNATTLA
jgi:hypothetical protein